MDNENSSGATMALADPRGAGGEGIAVAPSLRAAQEAVTDTGSMADTGSSAPSFERRIVVICLLAVGVAAAAAVIAQLLGGLIALVTNLAFYGRLSTAAASPAGNHLGVWVLFVPAIGGLIVGLMARYGSRAIRGHGIPEAMEQVLTNGSRIPPRITFLKPASAAIAIGTGGPFGAEGPIIATGGALGSLLGQLLETTAEERKTLLAAGAAAGMAATFGSPVSAVLLAIELLLFEFRPRSFLPVAFAAATATGVRHLLLGPAATAEPVFALPGVLPAPGGALVFYTVLGLALGLAAVGVTRLVYVIEDAFEKLPIHWMWWPTLGGFAVGLIGYFAPHTLGVGYTNIEQAINGQIVGTALLMLVVMKFASWAISLGSGTSGGTLAPLLTIGGGTGALLGEFAAHLWPGLGIDPRLAALVGMAALFAGASRALLASVVFAFETTLQPSGILPLLAGCSASYLLSSLLMRHTIMTEKIARRGIRVPAEYAADLLATIPVRAAATKEVHSLRADESLKVVRVFLASRAPHATHQGYPVLDADGVLVGVVTRRDLLDSATPEESTVGDQIRRAPLVVQEDETLREAADRMVLAGVGRLPVVRREAPREVVGILTRGDLLAAQRPRLEDSRRSVRHIHLSRPRRPMARPLQRPHKISASAAVRSGKRKR